MRITLPPTRLAASLSLACAAVLAAPAALAANSLVYCSEASPEGFDIGQFTGGNTFDAVGYTIYNRLAEFVPGGTDIEPSLAESWTVSDDGKTIIFKLRHGVKFHTTSYFKPTRDFDADDVVFTLKRLTDKNFPFNKAYPAEFPYAQDTGLADNLANVEAVDPYTVKLTLKEADADILVKLAMPFASILSSEYANQLLKEGKAAEINQQPVGTGPFPLVRYEKDASIRYKANKEYWNKGAVKLDSLIFAITPDAAVRAQKLKANECQVIFSPKPQDIADLKNAKGVTILQAPGFNIGYLNYNVEKLPDLRVRQALDMAINRKAILQAVYQGMGSEAVAPFPPSLWGYNDTLKNAPYDPEKAKALLAEAGKSNMEIDLWAMPVQRPYNPNAKLMAEMIQADWAKIGVKANIVTYEWGEYLKRMKNGEHTTGLMGWTGDYASPDNFLGVLLTCDAVNGSNNARYCNKDFDKLVVGARSVMDVSKRTEMYKQAQVIFKQDLPWTTIAHSVINQPLRDNVVGYKISPLGSQIFTNVSVK